MPKDFSEVLKDTQKQSQKLTPIDPYLIPNSVIKQQIESSRNQKKLASVFTTLCTAFAFNPLNVISKSLQMSVIPHLDIYNNSNTATQKNTKSVVKTNTSLTIQQKRRLQLIIRSGQTTKPFTAPIYHGYAEAFKGLMNQGYQAFWKGSISRLWILACREIALSYISTPLYNYTKSTGKEYFVFRYFMLSAIDVALNPFYQLEAKFILQNRLKQFKSYKSIMKAWKTRRDPYRGSTAHLALNLFDTLAISVPYYIGSVPLAIGLSITMRIAEFATLTSYTRLIAQAREHSMIPERYGSVTHGIRLIYQEEGRRGLFKGFLAFYALRTIIATMSNFFIDPFQPSQLD